MEEALAETLSDWESAALPALPVSHSASGDVTRGGGGVISQRERADKACLRHVQVLLISEAFLTFPIAQIRHTTFRCS